MSKNPETERTECPITDKYWSELKRLGKFDHPTLSKLRKELKAISDEQAFNSQCEPQTNKNAQRN